MAEECQELDLQVEPSLGFHDATHTPCSPPPSLLRPLCTQPHTLSPEARRGLSTL